jgi:hypothetical protein
VRFLIAFSAGDFTVTFTRKDSGTSRSYHIGAGPPHSVWQKFAECSICEKRGPGENLSSGRSSDTILSRKLVPFL